MAAKPENLSADDCFDEAERLLDGTEEEQRLAIPFLESAARRGQTEAAYRLGMAYLVGEPLEQDDKKAFKWLRMAALAGDGAAACRVADLSFDGRGTRRDPAKAAKWYLQAAEAGEEEAFLSVALCYLTGDAFRPSEPDAVEWLDRAERAGSIDARGKRLLGGLLIRGAGAHHDPERGHRLLQEAASDGDIEASKMVQRLAKDED